MIKIILAICMLLLLAKLEDYNKCIDISGLKFKKYLLAYDFKSNIKKFYSNSDSYEKSVLVSINYWPVLFEVRAFLINNVDDSTFQRSLSDYFLYSSNNIGLVDFKECYIHKEAGHKILFLFSEKLTPLTDHKKINIGSNSVYLDFNVIDISAKRIGVLYQMALTLESYHKNGNTFKKLIPDSFYYKSLSHLEIVKFYPLENEFPTASYLEYYFDGYDDPITEKNHCKDIYSLGMIMNTYIYNSRPDFSQIKECQLNTFNRESCITQRVNIIKAQHNNYRFAVDSSIIRKNYNEIKTNLHKRVNELIISMINVRCSMRPVIVDITKELLEILKSFFDKNLTYDLFIEQIQNKINQYDIEKRYNTLNTANGETIFNKMYADHVKMYEVEPLKTPNGINIYKGCHDKSLEDTLILDGESDEEKEIPIGNTSLFFSGMDLGDSIDFKPHDTSELIEDKEIFDKLFNTGLNTSKYLKESLPLQSKKEKNLGDYMRI